MFDGNFPHGRSVLSSMMLLTLLARGPACLSSTHVREPVSIIFDTDMGYNIDDAAALGILHKLADNGEAKILAVMTCNRNKWSAAVCDIINTYYGRPDVPIGSAKKGPYHKRFWNRYWERLVSQFPHDLTSGHEAPDTTEIYRRILAEEPDKNVIIVAVGFLTNLKELLDSKPDRFSELSGAELIRQKIGKLVAVGGGYSSAGKHQTWSFKADASAAKLVVENWPTPIVFTGREIGEKIRTGARLRAEEPQDSPLRIVYDCVLTRLKEKAHPSWDQTAVLYAVRGLRGYWSEHTTGCNYIHDDGRNEWKLAPNKDHSYLVEKMGPNEVARVIEDLLLQSPK
ncbi:MAG: nucleoside hydrolase [Phycisphaerales bacterium]|nr:MAG: nucleoside hydrolase [Phycisphaerales bacterium]